MIDVVVPEEQEGTKAVVRAWLKQVGDAVAENDPLVELETDKVTQEVPAPAAGVQPVTLYMDLWHGECRAAYEVQDPSAHTPEFAIEAPLRFWRSVITGRLDPIQALMTRQLKLKGPMLKVMRAPRAAAELVRCCGRVPTTWPAAEPSLA